MHGNEARLNQRADACSPSSRGLLLCQGLTKVSWSNEMDLLAQNDEASGRFVLRPGGQIPAEGDLRKIITPDQWCAYESMRCGVIRMGDAGLVHHTRLAQLPPERLRLAFEQLPPSPVCCATTERYLLRQ